MSSVNKIFLVGRLGQDPKVVQFQNGDCVANASLATSSSWKDRTTGERKESVQWHRLVVKGKNVENFGKFASKGRLLAIEGSMQYRKFTNKDRVEQTIAEVIVLSWTLLDKAPDNAGDGGGSYDNDDQVPF